MYETGVKSDFFEHRVRLNATYYYGKYENLQQPVVTSSGAVSNVNNTAKVRGLEFEARALPFTGFELSAMLSTLHDEIDNSALRLPNAPRLTWNTSARYSLPVLDKGTASAMVSYAWNDESFEDAQNTPILRVESYKTVDANVSFLTSDEHWQFALAGLNLTDDVHATGGFYIAGGALAAVEMAESAAAVGIHGALPALMNEQGTPKRDVRLIDIVTLGAGAAVGVAMFSIFAPAARLAGPSMLIALLLAAVPMALFAVVYAFMGSAVPSSGAAYVWHTRFLHPFAGFMIAWLRILGSAGVMVVLALVLVQHWGMIIDVPLKPTMFGVFTVFYLLNLFGVSLAARAQTVLFCLLGAVLALLVFSGAPHIEPTHFAPFLPQGLMGMLAAVPLLVSLFLGIESATEVGDEIRGVKRVISRGIAISVGVTLVIYGAVSVVVLGVVGPAELAATHYSVAPCRREGARARGEVLHRAGGDAGDHQVAQRDPDHFFAVSVCDGTEWGVAGSAGEDSSALGHAVCGDHGGV